MVLSKRCRIYNEQLDLVEQLEDRGRIVVIRPEKPMEVDRIETDIKKLTDLYEEGYACDKKKCSKEKRILTKINFWPKECFLYMGILEEWGIILVIWGR